MSIQEAAAHAGPGSGAEPNGDDHVFDCVVIGGGMAGLAAGWQLRDRDILVLEAEPRVGGRVKSEKRGNYWLSVGAHMFGEPESIVGRMVEDLSLETLRIHGDMLAISWEHKVYRGARPEVYPLRLPFARQARVDFVRAGLKIRRAAAQYERLSHQRPEDTPGDVRKRLLSYLDDRTFAQLIGSVHPQVDALFRATAHRMTAEPEDVAAGCMAALFAHVWSSGDTVLGRNMRGGSAELPTAVARQLGTRVVVAAPVEAVSRENGTVTATYRHEGRSRTARARFGIVATPAYVTRTVIQGLPPRLDHALGTIDYGPFVVGAILTKETTAMPWDNLYSVLTPERSFTMFFNHANVLRALEKRRAPGGALMVYAGGGPARRLLDKSDDQITTTFVEDLNRVFPESRGIVDEVWIQRWPKAQPFQKPGRSLFQDLFEQPISDRIFLAGDYVGDWAHMESAAQMGREAAIRVRAGLAQTAGTPT